MHDPAYTDALSIFAKAEQDNAWDPNALPAWYQSRALSHWEHLESAWQGAYCPQVFSWAVLRAEVQMFAHQRGLPPLEVLGTFLYPRQTNLGYEGDWLDWQTDDVKTDIYKTAQQWLEQSTVSLEKQAYTLLSLAAASHCMPLWRQAPVHCVEHMDWRKALYRLNACPKEELQTSDIWRVAMTEPEQLRNGMDTRHPAGCMVYCETLNWRTIAKHLETHEGPGLWLQYVFTGPEHGLLERRQEAWMKMPLRGLDAWAMEQLYRPSARFEDSLKHVPSDTGVHLHLEWAHRWWLHSVLGMSTQQALHLVCRIKTPGLEETSLALPDTLMP